LDWQDLHVAGHSARAHRHAGGRPADVRHARVVIVLIALIAAGVVGGLITLWPPRHQVATVGADTAHGTVTASQPSACQSGSTGCTVAVTVRIDDGPDRGHTTQLTFVPGPTDPQLRVGERIRMGRQGSGSGAVYAFADIERTRPMLLLGLLFALVVLVVGRARGLAAMLGVAFAGISLVVFVIPALVAGESPTAVALIGGAAVVLVVLPLAHGFSVKTAAALIGTVAGMAVASVLSMLSVHAMHFTGTSSDEAATLKLLNSRSSVAGLLLCAAVFGAIGVLNDVTVTQASSVFEIAAADPGLDRRGLVRSAMRIGRDHIASTVYSLVLAYAGSALPLLLLFTITGQSTVDVLTSDALGPEIAASLIGATALVLVVPLTTLIAAALAHREPAQRPEFSTR
jgi:uncharacterized membrane protein